MASKKGFKPPVKKQVASTKPPHSTRPSKPLSDSQYEEIIDAVVHFHGNKSPVQAESMKIRATEPREGASLENSQSSQPADSTTHAKINHDKSAEPAAATTADSETQSVDNSCPVTKQSVAFKVPKKKAADSESSAGYSEDTNTSSLASCTEKLKFKRPKTLREALKVQEGNSQYSSGLSQLASKNSLLTQDAVLSQPPKHLRHRERLQWLQDRRGVGLYIQCDNCKKWRWSDIDDPVDVPKHWTCRMNPDGNYDQCLIPEKPISAYIEEDLIHNEYTAGSIVWAKLFGYPWWPAMVDDCPDTEQYYWLDGYSDIPIHYHVVFFDSEHNEVNRAWVAVRDMISYKQEPHLDKKFLMKPVHKCRVDSAKLQAEAALKLRVKQRLRRYSFLARWPKQIVTPPASDTELEETSGEGRRGARKQRRAANRIDQDSQGTVRTDEEKQKAKKNKDKNRRTSSNAETDNPSDEGKQRAKKTNRNTFRQDKNKNNDDDDASGNGKRKDKNSDKSTKQSDTHSSKNITEKSTSKERIDKRRDTDSEKKSKHSASSQSEKKEQKSKHKGSQSARRHDTESNKKSDKQKSKRKDESSASNKTDNKRNETESNKDEKKSSQEKYKTKHSQSTNENKVSDTQSSSKHNKTDKHSGTESNKNRSKQTKHSQQDVQDSKCTSARTPAVSDNKSESSHSRSPKDERSSKQSKNITKSKNKHSEKDIKTRKSTESKKGTGVAKSRSQQSINGKSLTAELAEIVGETDHKNADSEDETQDLLLDTDGEQTRAVADGDSSSVNSEIEALFKQTSSMVSLKCSQFLDKLVVGQDESVAADQDEPGTQLNSEQQEIKQYISQTFGDNVKIFDSSTQSVEEESDETMARLREHINQTAVTLDTADQPAKDAIIKPTPKAKRTAKTKDEKRAKRTTERDSDNSDVEVKSAKKKSRKLVSKMHSERSAESNQEVQVNKGRETKNKGKDKKQIVKKLNIADFTLKRPLSPDNGESKPKKMAKSDSKTSKRDTTLVRSSANSDTNKPSTSAPSKTVKKTKAKVFQPPLRKSSKTSETSKSEESCKTTANSEPASPPAEQQQQDVAGLTSSQSVNSTAAVVPNSEDRLLEILKRLSQESLPFDMD